MILTITHRRQWYEMRLPLMVFVNGIFVTTMTDDVIRLKLPPGIYEIRIQFGAPLSIGKKGKQIDLSISGTTTIDTRLNKDAELMFNDKERVWNILFDIDLVIWIVSFFVSMPPAYKAISNIFFAIWVIRLILIRKRYYAMEFRQCD